MRCDSQSEILPHDSVQAFHRGWQPGWSLKRRSVEPLKLYCYVNTKKCSAMNLHGWKLYDTMAVESSMQKVFPSIQSWWKLAPMRSCFSGFNSVLRKLLLAWRIRCSLLSCVSTMSWLSCDKVWLCEYVCRRVSYCYAKLLCFVLIGPQTEINHHFRCCKFIQHPILLVCFSGRRGASQRARLF